MIKSIQRKKIVEVSRFPKTAFGLRNKGKKISFPFFSFLKKQRIFSFLVFLIISFVLVQPNVSAPVFFYPKEVEALYDEEKAKLEKELEEIEKEIAQYEKIVAQTQSQKATLQNKINELKNKANKLSLQIKSTNVNLEQLNIRIEETTDSIIKTTDKINATKENLANLLQSFYQLKQNSLLEILLSSEEISSFFDYANALNNIQEKIQENITEMQALQETLNKQNKDLNADKEENQSLLAMQLLQKNDLEKTRKEQTNLLEVTKGNEQKYQQVLQESRKKANEIRSRIYELIGVKSQVTFGEALSIAEWVSSRTGVRTALLLAILTQESNLGKNVGTCNRPGDPPSKSWQQVMKPDRDRAPFLQITKELGLDPNTTPVSCPMRDSKGNQVGWGGAMGPAQFLPSTWLIYKDEVARINGKGSANPWDIRDSFIAAALYLARWGATSQTREAEWRAAMIYFSGSTNSRFRFYGDSVMAIADKYEKDIETLRQVAKNP